MDTEINLLPGKAKRNVSLVQKRNILRYISFGSLFVISFLSIVLFIFIALSPLPSLQQREKDEIKRLSFFNGMIIKLQLTKDRITQISRIFQKRSTYSTTIEEVRSLLPSGVVMEEVHIESNAVLITVSSTSLSFLDQFTQELIQFKDNAKKSRKLKIVTIQRDFKKGKYIYTVEII